MKCQAALVSTACLIMYCIPALRLLNTEPSRNQRLSQLEKMIVLCHVCHRGVNSMMCMHAFAQQQLLGLSLGSEAPIIMPAASTFLVFLFSVARGKATMHMCGARLQ